MKGFKHWRTPYLYLCRDQSPQSPRFPIQLFLLTPASTHLVVDAQPTEPKISFNKYVNVGISNSKSKVVPPLRVGPKNALNRAILGVMIWIAQFFTIEM